MKRTINISISVFAEQLLGDRQNQEDAMGVSGAAVYHSKGLLAVVSDGMGGMERGEVYSGSAVSTLQQALIDETESAAPLDRRLEALYAKVREAALALRQSPGDADGGATVVAVLIKKQMCSTLSVGDSRICLLRKGGLIQLNREQTLGPLLDQRAAFGLIPQEVADNMPHRDSLTNHTNADQPLECDISVPFPLIPGDKLLLMSDGVFNALDDDALVRCLALPGRAGAEAIKSAIVEAAVPKQDNATFMILEVNEKPNKSAR